jgi:hypothetical protein
MPTEPRMMDGYESATLRAPRILVIAAGSLLLLFGSIGGLAIVYRIDAPSASPPPPRVFAEPRLRVDEAGQLHERQAHQRAELEQYRWIDKQNGVIRIPVARAMELIAKRGADAYAPISGVPAQPKARP